MSYKLAAQSANTHADIVPWDIEEYSQAVGRRNYGRHAQDEATLQEEFPIPHIGHLTEPAVIVDIAGRILTWYLPGLLNRERQVCIPSARAPRC